MCYMDDYRRALRAKPPCATATEALIRHHFRNEIGAHSFRGTEAISFAPSNSITFPIWNVSPMRDQSASVGRDRIIYIRLGICIVTLRRVVATSCYGISAWMIQTWMIQTSDCYRQEQPSWFGTLMHEKYIPSRETSLQSPRGRGQRC